MFAYWIPAFAGMTNHDAALFMSLCINRNVRFFDSGITQYIEQYVHGLVHIVPGDGQ